MSYIMPYKDPIKKKKYTKINTWKSSGLIGDYEAIYNRYINTSNCDLCNVFLEGKGINRKCMEHNHTTGEFRNIVCHKCNMNKSDNKKQKNNISGYKNILYNKTRKHWIYEKVFKGKLIKKYSKSKIEILCIKFAAIILYKY